ncbi:MAG: protoheme IX farnesyltransferase [Myxococcaceae bacterium]|nr:protoheme IX farnesyltransferase [Myxococcaceae bacterium]
MRVVADQQVEPRSFAAVLRDVVSLTKPRLSLLVLFTCAGGMWLSGLELPLHLWVVTLLATAGTVGAANAFNCFMERDSDRHMARTAVRPLPAGRMEPAFALLFAASLTVVSVPALFIGVGPVPGALGVLALTSYVLAYTPLKARTHWAMVVGALPGALPPLMGWAAATGKISAGGLTLFAILFLWQLPHFIAIALFRKEEYRNAGLQSLPLATSDVEAWRWAVGYLLALVLVAGSPYLVGVSGWVYGVGAVVFSAAFLAAGVRGLRTPSTVNARKLFGASLVYLLALFVLLGVDAVIR